jgi:hypothetical protein
MDDRRKALRRVDALAINDAVGGRCINDLVVQRILSAQNAMPCSDVSCHTLRMMQRAPRVQIALAFTILMSAFVLVSIILRAQVVVNVATVAATLIAATALYLSLAAEPTEEKISSAVIELAALLEDSWGNRMTLLLGRDDDRPAGSQPRPAGVRFARISELELASQADLETGGTWSTVYADFYQKISGGRLVIAGDPGYGKTLLAIELVLQILRARKVDNLTESQLPVPVSVAGWDGAESLPVWLVRRLKEEWHLSPEIGRILIRRHLILPVLDGLDEIGARQAEENPLDRQFRVLRRLNSSVGAWKGTEPIPVVVTCRTGDYRQLKAAAGGLLNSAVVAVQPLDRRLIREYLLARFDPALTLESADRAQWLEFAGRLDHYPESVLERCLTSPWYLSLAISACRAGETTVADLEIFHDIGELEQYLTELSISAAVRLYPEGLRSVDSIARDGTPERMVENEAQYDSEDVRRWLTTLAEHLDWQAGNGMSPTNIELRALWRLAAKNNDHPRLVHASIGVIGGILAGILGGEVADGVAGVVIMSLTIALGAGFGLWAGLRSNPRPSRVTLPRADEKRGRAVIFLTVLIAVAAGFAGDLIGKSAAIGVSEGVSAGFATLVLAGFGDRRVKALSPSDALRTDLFFGLVAGIVYVAVGGLPGGLTGGLLSHLHLNKYLTVPGSVALALIIGLTAGISLASRCWLRYAISVTMEASRRRIPLRFARFMDWAYGAGLLRITGISYQFRHEKLKSSLTPQSQGGGTAEA